MTLEKRTTESTATSSRAAAYHLNHSGVSKPAVQLKPDDKITDIPLSPGRDTNQPTEAWPATQRQNVVQRILHKGTTTRSETFTNARKRGTYTAGEVRKYIDSPKHYYYDKEKDLMVEIVPKPKKDRKRKRADSGSSGSAGEFTGWMAQVAKGTEEYSKGGTSKISYKAQELKDEGKGGFNVGINNIASIEDLKKTDSISDMTKTQQQLNFFANHIVRSVVEDDGALADDEKDSEDVAKEKKQKRKKRKLDLGPEVQQIVGRKDKELHSYIGGNSQKSQEMLKDKLYDRRRKRRSLGAYHKAEYREKTVQEAIKELKIFLGKNPPIEAQLKKMIDEKKSDTEVKAMLRSKIGNKYKTQRLQYLYTLRNSLKAQYGDKTLEDAMITIPDNEKAIHAESNLLEKVIGELEILDVMGTKVPCIACFAKFCMEKKQAHLLQYTSLIWFSQPCMSQLGCDYNKQTADEVLKYLNEIDNNLKGMLTQVKMYTGTMGDIKQQYHDDDSDSMGEESRQDLVNEYRSKSK